MTALALLLPVSATQQRTPQSVPILPASGEGVSGSRAIASKGVDPLPRWLRRVTQSADSQPPSDRAMPVFETWRSLERPNQDTQLMTGSRIPNQARSGWSGNLDGPGVYSLSVNALLHARFVDAWRTGWRIEHNPI